jgi:hypothetical protein
MELDRIAEIAADYRVLARRFAQIVKRLRAADNGLPALGIDWGRPGAHGLDFTFLGSPCRMRFEVLAFESGSTFGVLIAERLTPNGGPKPAATVFFDTDGKLFLTHPMRTPLVLSARADLCKVVAHLLSSLVPRVGLSG